MVCLANKAAVAVLRLTATSPRPDGAVPRHRARHLRHESALPSASRFTPQVRILVHNVGSVGQTFQVQVQALLSLLAVKVPRAMTYVVRRGLGRQGGPSLMISVVQIDARCESKCLLILAANANESTQM